MELREREDLLAALDAHLTQVADARAEPGWGVATGGREGRVVFLAGEAGIGKTALLEAFLAAAARRVDVAVGACEPLSTPRPLGPLLDLAAVLGGGLARAAREGASRDALFEAFLTQLAKRENPLLVAFEDAHWADASTLDLLLLLGRRAERLPVLVVATYRDDEVKPDHPLRAVLGHLATSPAVARLHVPALGERAVAAWARERRGGAVDPRLL